MEAICSTETSVDFQRITRRYIPEDSTRHKHRCENFKSYLKYDNFEFKFIYTNKGLRHELEKLQVF
jgi:hypothetical protein